MPEWTINIESPPDVTRDDEALERFAQALYDDGRVLAPAASLNTGSGRLAVTMQITAPRREDAAFAASLIYWGALGSAGLETNADSSLVVEPIDGGTAIEFVSQRPIRPR